MALQFYLNYCCIDNKTATEYQLADGVSTVHITDRPLTCLCGGKTINHRFQGERYVPREPEFTTVW